MTLISIGLAAWSISSVVTALEVLEAKTSTIELVSQTWELQPLVGITFVQGVNAQCPTSHPEVLSRWSFPVSSACPSHGAARWRFGRKTSLLALVARSRGPRSRGSLPLAVSPCSQRLRTSLKRVCSARCRESRLECAPARLGRSL